MYVFFLLYFADRLVLLPLPSLFPLSFPHLLSVIARLDKGISVLFTRDCSVKHDNDTDLQLSTKSASRKVIYVVKHKST